MKIMQTNNYEQFSTIVGNRSVVPQHVRLLQNSMAKTNMLEANPILVNEKMQVIDGQHRLEAAKNSGIPVSYIVLEGAGLEEVQLLNSYQKGWTLHDYVSSYCDRGFQDYQVLDLFCKTYRLPISVGAALLGGKSKNLSMGIKEGKFTVTRTKEAETIGSHLMDYRKLLTPNIANDRQFVLALQYLHRKGIPHSEMIRKLSFQTSKLVKQVNTKEYLRTLEEIYNFKSKVQIRFF